MQQVATESGLEPVTNGSGHLWSVVAPMWRAGFQLLLPWLERGLGPLSESDRRLVAILEVVRIEDFIEKRSPWLPGRPAANRGSIARALVAKSVLNLPTTKALVERLNADRQLRVLCGFGEDVPSESTFSRTFEELAKGELASRVHQALVEQTLGERVVGHLSRDSTEIEAREKPDREGQRRKEQARQNQAKRPRGRPKKGEQRAPKEPTRLERQAAGMTLEQMLEDLPSACDVGAKRNSKGHQESWIGYKLHLDVVDGQIPISAILTSASLHDSQVALPLATMSAGRVTTLYDLMDSAYDAEAIKQHSRELGHIPIIDLNTRRNTALKEELQLERSRMALVGQRRPEDERYKARTASERVNARLKDEFGARYVRVRGHAKVLCHLMIGVLALTADQLIRVIT